MTHSIIQKSQLEGAHRLDAEYYQPEFLENEKIIKKSKFLVLGDISSIAYGTTPTEGVFENEGIPFIRSQNFNNSMVSESDLVFCTEKFHLQNKKSNVLPGDLLFAAVGATIGKLAIAQDNLGEGNINQNIARVRIQNKNWNPYYVGLFFNSKLGQLQILRLTTGNAQAYLNSEQIKSLIVPILSPKQQEEIKSYFKNIDQQINISKSLYSQAENLLLEKLGLEDFQIEDNLSYIVNLSEVQASNRIDSDFFQPKYDQLTNHLKKVKTQKLGNLLKRKTKQIKIHTDENYKYIEISDVNVSSGEVVFNEMLGAELPASAQIPISGGELIISKVRPTRGAISNIPKGWDNNFVCSGAFSVFEDKENLDEYLFMVLRSIVGKLQMERPCTGTSYPTITDQDIENIVIPILPQPTQQKIADLVQKSHSARQKSKELLKTAKRKVEEMIEKGDE